MNRLGKNLALINTILLSTACTSKNIDNSNVIVSQRVLEEPAAYSYDKDYYFAKIKLAPFDPEASQLISGLSGKFYFRDECLVFINDYGDITTPILPHGITQWNKESQTLTIMDKDIKMGQHISTNGSFRKVLEARKGICWEDTVAGIGTMELEISK